MDRRNAAEQLIEGCAEAVNVTGRAQLFKLSRPVRGSYTPECP
jgi:hypothetical protein